MAAPHPDNENRGANQPPSCPVRACHSPGKKTNAVPERKMALSEGIKRFDKI
jgi:hypothetical protein